MDKNILKYGIIALVIILIGFWITLFMEGRSGNNKEDYQASTTYPWMNATTTENETSAVYESVSGRFSVSHSSDLTVATTIANDQFGSSVSFLFPASLISGTNLSADSRISIEEKTTTDCLPTSFIAQPMIGDDDDAIKTETVSGKTYSTFGFSDAAAGNRYDTSIYSIAKGGQCYGLQLFLHSTNIGNYDPGTVREFDNAKVQAYFREILEGFEIK